MSQKRFTGQGNQARSLASSALGARDPRNRRNAQAAANPSELADSMKIDSNGRVSVDAHGPISASGRLSLRYDGGHMAESDSGELRVNVSGLAGGGVRRDENGKFSVLTKHRSPLRVDGNGELTFDEADAVDDSTGTGDVVSQFNSLIASLRKAKILSDKDEV